MRYKLSILLKDKVDIFHESSSTIPQLQFRVCMMTPQQQPWYLLILLDEKDVIVLYMINNR